MAMILCIWLLKPWIHSYNIKFLKDNQCNEELYKIIWARANTLPRLEGSTKISSSSEFKRYTVTLPVTDWERFSMYSQAKILKCINFTHEKYKDIRIIESPRINEDTDIIFGWTSNGIGKIYFDYDGSLVCYESEGKIKHYQCMTQDTISVKDHKGSHIAIHYRNKDYSMKFNGYPVFWTAKELHEGQSESESQSESQRSKSETWYTRPIRAMMLSDIYDLLSPFKL